MLKVSLNCSNLLKFSLYFLIIVDTMKLVICEKQSLHVITYMTLIVMAYYGPNAEILGNIKLNIWQFNRPIADISLIINGILLWQFCKINILKILKKLQQKYWFIFAIAEAYVMMEVNLL